MPTADPNLTVPTPVGVTGGEIFGRVMELVAVTVAFAAAGIWIGQDLSGWQWFVPWLFAIGCLIGLNVANNRGQYGQALFLLFAFGLLIAFGFVLILVNIPGGSLIYTILGLVIFGGYILVDFNRLRRAGQDEAIPLAAGIFLDILNVFLLFLRLFANR